MAPGLFKPGVVPTTFSGLRGLAGGLSSISPDTINTTQPLKPVVEPSAILISVKPEYAEAILSGKKTVDVNDRLATASNPGVARRSFTTEDHVVLFA